MSKRRLMHLDELIGRVENALDSCAIEVMVVEESGAVSSDPLHRLTRCLRSHGLLDEYTTRPEEK